MKKILQIFIVLCIPVFIWNCEKEVKVKYNHIKGTLSPGMDVTQDGLGSIPMVLVKIYDTIDLATVTKDASNFEDFYSTTTDAGGFYHFDSLPDGKYLLACGEGFKFSDVDYVSVLASDGSVNPVNKTVNRLAKPNGPDTYSIEVVNGTFWKITRLEFFVKGTSIESRETLVEPVEYGAWTDNSVRFDFVLDEDLEPTFQLSMVNQDNSPIKSPVLDFFEYGYWHQADEYLGEDYVWIREKKYDSKVYLRKGWWLGHWIKVCYDKPMNIGIV